MTKLLLTLFATTLLVGSATALAEDGPTWYPDFDAAAEVAKKEGKDLLVDFTGSDWCGWCIKLHDEVFQHEAFWKEAGKHYVFVALDFPRGEEAKAKVPNPERNQELQKKYGIRGFPTILLVTPAGEVFGRTGYQPGGPESYVAHLAEIGEKGKASLAEAAELEKEFAAAEGEARSAILEKAIEKLQGLEAGAPGMDTVARIARTAIEGEGADKALRKRVLEAHLDKGLVDAEIAKLGKGLDPKNEDGLYERVVAAELSTVSDESGIPSVMKSIEAFDALGAWKDKDLAIQIYATAAFWNHRFLKNPDEAKRYATKLKEIEPDPNPRLKGLLDQILGTK